MANIIEIPGPTRGGDFIVAKALQDIADAVHPDGELKNVLLGQVVLLGGKFFYRIPCRPVLTDEPLSELPLPREPFHEPMSDEGSVEWMDTPVNGAEISAYIRFCRSNRIRGRDDDVAVLVANLVQNSRSEWEWARAAYFELLRERFVEDVKAERVFIFPDGGQCRISRDLADYTEVLDRSLVDADVLTRWMRQEERRNVEMRFRAVEASPPRFWTEADLRDLLARHKRMRMQDHRRPTAVIAQDLSISTRHLTELLRRARSLDTPSSMDLMTQQLVGNTDRKARNPSPARLSADGAGSGKGSGWKPKKP